MILHLRGEPDPKFKDRFLGRTITGRVRSNCGYCDGLNLRFQGLAADGAKLSMWELFLADYFMVNFVHDEIMSELTLDEHLQERILKKEELMIRGMRRVIPDFLIQVEPAMMTHWSKQAYSLYSSDKRMQIWSPSLVKANEGDKPEDKSGYCLVWEDKALSKFAGWLPLTLKL